MKLRAANRAPFALLLCSILAQQLAQAATSYYVTDLGTFGGLTSNARALNDRGQIAGQADTTNGNAHAFIYEAGHMTDLGTLGGPTSGALAINQNGDMAGYADLANGSSHAFIYKGSMTDLGAMNGTLSIARGINNAGQVVGLAIVGGKGTGFLYNGSTMVDLTVLTGTPCNGCAINDNGQIVGQSFPSGSSYGSGFTYNGTMTFVGNYYGSIAQAVNNRGWVTVNPAGTTSHAFIYNQGTITDLGTLWASTSFAEGINDSGEVVGQSNVSVDTSHAFLYSGGHISDLNTLAEPGSGLTLTCGYAINAKGQIVGTGVNSLGNERAFLATPYRKLFLERSGSNMAISWFTNAPTALSLFQSTNIVSGNWLPVTNTAPVTNGQYQVLLPLTVERAHFFRLQSQ